MDWHAIAMDPAKPSHILSELTCLSQLVETKDGGKSWKIVETANPMIAWRNIAFAPSDPSIVYAGTSGFTSCGQFDQDNPGDGVYLSTDGGDRWTVVNDTLSENSTITSLSVHPTQPNTVYAVSAQKGLIKTTDAGKQWEPVTKDRAGKVGASVVAVHPADPKIIS